MPYLLSVVYSENSLTKKGVFRIIFDGTPTNQKLLEVLQNYAKIDPLLMKYTFVEVVAYYQVDL